MAIHAVHVCVGDSSILERAIPRPAPRRSLFTLYEFVRIVCGMGEGEVGLGGGVGNFHPSLLSYDGRMIDVGRISPSSQAHHLYRHIPLDSCLADCPYRHGS